MNQLRRENKSLSLDPQRKLNNSYDKIKPEVL